MQTIYRLGALMLGLVALALGAVYIGHLRTELVQAQEATQKAEDALKQTQATLAAREKVRVTTARRAASAQVSLATAIQPNPDWANTQTPQEVQNALCAVLDCAGTDPPGLRQPAPDDRP